MYKFLIKSTKSTVVTYKVYQEPTSIENETTGETEIKNVDYETDNLTVLSAKYKELLKIYSTETLIPIHSLNISLTTEITE